MNFDFYLVEIDSLIDYVIDYKENGYIGALGDISKSYQNIVSSIRYNWYFCVGLMYSNIHSDVKGTAMEFDAILHRLKTLKGRLNSVKEYSNIHIDMEFSKLKERIITEIRKCEISIDIAVAWLSDEEICKELITVAEKGIKVRVLMVDCTSNKASIIKSNDLIETVFAPEFGKYNKNYMHNKFCIFDLNTVITGSYNWSSNGNYNNENIVIILNEEIAKKFTIQFNKLVNNFRMG